MVFLCCNFKLFLCNDLTIVRFRFFPPSKNAQHQFLSKIQYEKSTVLKYRLQKKTVFLCSSNMILLFYHECTGVIVVNPNGNEEYFSRRFMESSKFRQYHFDRFRGIV